MNEIREWLTNFLPLCQETAVWGPSKLAITYYLAKEMPPDELITSVRCVVLQGQAVLAVRDSDTSWHIVPGGRREQGETLEETMRRELLEETGWTIERPNYFAFARFNHLTARPDGYPYPYPDFCQIYYVANAGKFYPAAQRLENYVLEARFWTVTAIEKLISDKSQNLLLQAVLAE